MPTLRERLADLVHSAGVSHGIHDKQGELYFVSADGFYVDSEGNLLFWKARRRHIIAAIAAGEWMRVLRGISLEDYEGGEMMDNDDVS